MGVKRVALGSLLKLERIPLEIDPDAEYVQIGIRSFGKGIFHRTPTRGGDLSKLRYFELRPNRLIVSNIMAWEGAIAVSGDVEKGCIASSRFLSYAPTEKVDLSYLNYFFQSEMGFRLIRGTSTGTVLRNQTLSIKDFESMEICLPELDRQRNVATRLDLALGKLGRMEELRGGISRTSAATVESVLASVVAQDPPRCQIIEVLRADRTPIEIDPDGPYRALGLRSFGKGTIRYAPVPGAELSKLRYFAFPENALVLSNIKAWEGAISVTTGEDLECVASNRFLFYSPRDSRVNIGFVRYYLLSKAGLADVGACSPGMADRNRTLGIKAFERLRIPLPGRDVQDRVVRVLDGVTGGLAKAVAMAEGSKALRTSVLNAAFHGRL
ncbi:hypothetical protein HII36_27835 [Nonomuraea sp. NN258]|uniref:restriction endonuclease subunit S n=1 Tax=Nonomuraea antri TaxID=2730852 RepID=UPI001568CEDC|nr:hypothetical protein [Nonomuraea antri]NRQ35616.1 hypothetical protein [Nonomuraea antri]